jgi:hypothetical protein
MSKEGGSADSTMGAAAREHSLLARLCSASMPDDPAARDAFFARLLPDFDVAWREVVQVTGLCEAARASLLGLRKCMEQGAERAPRLRDGARRYLRLFAIPVLIEMDSAAPESQVDCALAWAADAAHGAVHSLPGTSLVCMSAFFRYQDLVAAPLSAVHDALVRAASEGNPAAALRRMPFRAGPAAARCSPIYLRFVVGVALSESDGEIDPDGSRWSELEEVIRAVLGARLHVPLKVTAAYCTSLYAAAHDGLRKCQAARLDRIVAAIGARRGVSALLDLRDADAQRRARLALMRDRSSLAACMLQMPLDEGPAEMLARIAAWLRSREVTDIASLTPGGVCNGLHFPFLAVLV